ncbi:MAG: hypothetical protein HFI67_01080 [Lachnospiraceae bacterium]|nr:hypothetical protein [Lachnospiraceae bacterium]
MSGLLWIFCSKNQQHKRKAVSLLHNDTMRSLAHTLADAEHAGIKVQIGPVQGDQLPAPAAGEGSHDKE